MSAPDPSLTSRRRDDARGRDAGRPRPEPATTPAALAPADVSSDGESMAASVLFSLFAPAFVIASFVMLLAAPPALALLACTALYGIVALAEFSYGIHSPESVMLLGFYAVLAAALRLAPDAAPFQYASLGIVAALTLLSAVLVAADKPLAAFYLRGRGYRRLHVAVTRLWLAAYGGALAVSLALIATPWFRYVPLVSALAGALGVVTLSFIAFGSAHRRVREFELGDYTFREIERGDAALAAFLEAYAEEIWSTISRGGARGQAKPAKAAILDDAWHTEKAITDPGSVYYFNAYHHGSIVGGIAVALDRPGRRLPAEESFGVVLDRLRRVGRVMEVRRLSIDRQHRLQPDILRGLFKCIVEVAMERRVSFIVDFAFSFAAPVLDKVGLRILDIPGCDVRMFGAPMRLLAMNLAALTITRAQGVTSAASVGGLLNPYLLERYVKHLVLRQGWRAAARRAWSLSVPQIEDLCVPAGNAATAGATPDAAPVSRKDDRASRDLEAGAGAGDCGAGEAAPPERGRSPNRVTNGESDLHRRGI